MAVASLVEVQRKLRRREVLRSEKGKLPLPTAAAAAAVRCTLLIFAARSRRQRLRGWAPGASAVTWRFLGGGQSQITAVCQVCHLSSAARGFRLRAAAE